MNEENWWVNWAIDDLRLIRSEAIDLEDDENEAGAERVLHCIYSFKLDSVTFVEVQICQALLQRGIVEQEEMPEPLP